MSRCTADFIQTISPSTYGGRYVQVRSSAVFVAMEGVELDLERAREEIEQRSNTEIVRSENRKKNYLVINQINGKIRKKTSNPPLGREIDVCVYISN